MITKEQVNQAWKELYDYEEYHFGGPGNGCDDYRDIPDEVFRKKIELENKARKLQKEFNESQHYVPNDVFQFTIQVDNDLFSKEITVYTKPFHEFILGELSEKEWSKEYRKQEEFVQKKFFTQEKINELKQELIKKIQECDNPFYIFCSDRDGGYNVTEEQLFSLEKYV